MPVTGSQSVPLLFYTGLTVGTFLSLLSSLYARARARMKQKLGLNLGNVGTLLESGIEQVDED